MEPPSCICRGASDRWATAPHSALSGAEHPGGPQPANSRRTSGRGLSPALRPEVASGAPLARSALLRAPAGGNNTNIPGSRDEDAAPESREAEGSGAPEGRGELAPAPAPRLAASPACVGGGASPADAPARGGGRRGVPPVPVEATSRSWEPRGPVRALKTGFHL